MDLNALMQGMAPLQEAMKKAEAERLAAVLEGQAGGGAVSVQLKGDLTLQKVTIVAAAAAAAEGDVEMLEDLVLLACNDALKQYTERFGATAEEQMQKSMGDTGLAGMLGSMLS